MYIKDNLISVVRCQISVNHKGKTHLKAQLFSYSQVSRSWILTPLAFTHLVPKQCKFWAVSSSCWISTASAKFLLISRSLDKVFLMLSIRQGSRKTQLLIVEQLQVVMIQKVKKTEVVPFPSCFEQPRNDITCRTSFSNTNQKQWQGFCLLCAEQVKNIPHPQSQTKSRFS